MKLNVLQRVIEEILERDIESRNDNFILTNEVYKALGIDTNNNMAFLLRNHAFYKLPSFESIARARRKVVKKKPYLNGNEVKREEMELEYREYSRT